MLELTRRLYNPDKSKKEQRDKIVIILPDGQEMEIYLSKIQGYQATLSFNFPSNVGVWRAEKWVEIKSEKNNADLLK